MEEEEEGEEDALDSPELVMSIGNTGQCGLTLSDVVMMSRHLKGPFLASRGE